MYSTTAITGAVVDWLKHVFPKEHWVLVIDSDMLLRKVFRPKDFNASQVRPGVQGYPTLTLNPYTPRSQACSES
jgi:hypothetical protein